MNTHPIIIVVVQLWNDHDIVVLQRCSQPLRRTRDTNAEVGANER